MSSASMKIFISLIQNIPRVWQKNIAMDWLVKLNDCLFELFRC
jgi:hypothetical protein